MRLGVDAVALDQPHRVEQVGEEQPVDDEAGGVGHLDGGLLEPLAEAVQLALGLGGRLAGNDSSTSFIFSTGLNT